MNKIIGLIKSRTVWTVIALVLLNGAPSARDLIPPQYLPCLDSLLGLLAIYFRVNPRQQF
jgi:hypothetical protein